ncbi:MAG: hypothetical protein M1821_008601 [Bathelium mastoideum]|nr:MAG: hypothetical protein M1821_008601 [Bathelium mastoideum]
MAWRIDDHWLWLGFGAFLFIAAKGITYGLHDIVNLTTITEEPEPEEDPIRAQENCSSWSLTLPRTSSLPYFHLSINSTDRPTLTFLPPAISLTSLRILAEHPNLDIRHASIRILIKRFLAHPVAPAALSADLASRDPAAHLAATCVADLLHFHKFPVPSSNPNPTTNFALRPLPGALPHHYFDNDEEDRTGVGVGGDGDLDQHHFSFSGSTHSLPTSVHQNILNVRRRRREAVARARAWAANPTRLPSPRRGDGPVPPQRWGEEESPEETELRRRRHREAMVLHEGSGGLSEEDIIPGPATVGESSGMRRRRGTWDVGSMEWGWSRFVSGEEEGGDQGERQEGDIHGNEGADGDGDGDADGSGSGVREEAR